MQLLVASAGDEADAAQLAAEAPRWFNTCAAPWARLAAIYASAEVTPPAFAFQVRESRQWHHQINREYFNHRVNIHETHARISNVCGSSFSDILFMPGFMKNSKPFAHNQSLFVFSHC